MQTQQKEVTVNKDLVEEILPDHEFESSKCNQMKVSVRYSDSAHKTTTSSIVCSHWQCAVARPKQMTDELSLYNKGSKRREKKLK